ncbi:MAG TPA: alpha/beta fold hydrolase [Solirubrobacteraceae bacterium]|nr:alpha/beta fold hydrolase [Solirubrobacteraceae bacterium]
MRLHVASAGHAKAPPLLLVHGWPQNWWAWRELIPQLAVNHRVIVPDLPGFGWSEGLPGAYEKETLASQLLALLDALSLERVTWIGHDWGGWLGFLAALRAPERLERMLAITIPHFWAPPTARQAVAALGYQVPISLPVVGPRLADPMVRRLLQVGRGRNPLAAEDVDRFADHIPPDVTVSMYRTLLTRELAPIRGGRYSSQTLEVPTTVMLGAEDLITHGTPAGPVRGQPQLHVEILEGVAHWIPEQRPDAVIRWVAG